MPRKPGVRKTVYAGPLRCRKRRPMNVVVQLLMQLWPLLYRAVFGAQESGSCPRAAIKAVMDGEEAAAIVAEWVKFHGPKEEPSSDVP